MKKWNVLCLSVAIAGLLFSLPLGAGETQKLDENFDRLDGTGKSAKKVNVIEWEGNLELHVYPKGSLVGLGLKLDKTNKDKPVMIISYRFDNAPKAPLIRRAILSISLQEGFKAFRDPSADDYDKVIISNNGLASPLFAFKLDPQPSQLYPEGHPAQRSVASDSKVQPNTVQKAKPPSFDEDSGTIRPFQ